MHPTLQHILTHVKDGVPGSWNAFVKAKNELLEVVAQRDKGEPIEEVCNDLELAEFFSHCDLSKLPAEAYLEFFSLPLLSNLRFTCEMQKRLAAREKTLEDENTLTDFVSFIYRKIGLVNFIKTPAVLALSRDGIRIDFKFKDCREIASKDGASPIIQFCLAMMYEHGLGTNTDTALALSYYQKAAEQGLHLAQYKLGLIFKDTHVEFSYDKAYEWISKAAAGGLVEAQYWMSEWHLVADLPESDLDEGLQWLMKAVAQGYAPAKRLFEDRLEQTPEKLLGELVGVSNRAALAAMKLAEQVSAKGDEAEAQKWQKFADQNSKAAFEASITRISLQNSEAPAATEENSSKRKNLTENPEEENKSVRADKPDQNEDFSQEIAGILRITPVP